MIRTDGIRFPDGPDMESIDEAGHTYLGILETDKIKEKAMKEKFSKEYLQWLRGHFHKYQTQLCLSRKLKKSFL